MSKQQILDMGMNWAVNNVVRRHGFDFDVDIEDRPIAILEIYDRKVEKLWTNKEFADRKASKTFVSQALRWLPGGHFIIFFFDGTDEYFVQFFNEGGNVILDFPMWPVNHSFGKQKEFIKILRSLNFKRIYSRKNTKAINPNTFYYVSRNKNKKEMRALFGENYSVAADVALLIAAKIYGFDKTGVLRYLSDNLIPEKE